MNSQMNYSNQEFTKETLTSSKSKKNTKTKNSTSSGQSSACALLILAGHMATLPNAYSAFIASLADTAADERRVTATRSDQTTHTGACHTRYTNNITTSEQSNRHTTIRSKARDKYRMMQLQCTRRLQRLHTSASRNRPITVRALPQPVAFSDRSATARQYDSFARLCPASKGVGAYSYGFVCCCCCCCCCGCMPAAAAAAVVIADCSVCCKTIDLCVSEMAAMSAGERGAASAKADSLSNLFLPKKKHNTNRKNRAKSNETRSKTHTTTTATTRQ